MFWECLNETPSLVPQDVPKIFLEHFLECSENVSRNTLSEHLLNVPKLYPWNVPKVYPAEHFQNTSFEHLSNVPKVYPMGHFENTSVYVIGRQAIRINFDNFRPAMRSIQRLSSTVHESGSLIDGICY